MISENMGSLLWMKPVSSPKPLPMLICALLADIKPKAGIEEERIHYVVKLGRTAIRSVLLDINYKNPEDVKILSTKQ